MSLSKRARRARGHQENARNVALDDHVCNVAIDDAITRRADGLAQVPADDMPGARFVSMRTYERRCARKPGKTLTDFATPARSARLRSGVSATRNGYRAMTFSRRNFIVATAGLGASLIGGGLAGCASPAPRATTVGPGATRVALGSITITTFTDGYFERPLDAGFVRNAPLSAVQAALRDANLPADKVTVPFTPLVVETTGQRVLFDAGNGEFGAATSGRLLENMSRAGITPASITAVVISHFHGDHINGLRNKAGAPVFPNAKVYVPEPEWNWWMDDARMASAPDAMKGAFAATRRVFGPIASNVTRFAPGAEVLPGVRSMPAYGHTPGHTVFTFDGGTRKAMYWADTTNVAALFVRNPDWAVMFDMDADAARQTRRRIADHVIRENMLLAGFHLPGAAIGSLSARGSGYEFTPLAA
jgi:glyoxylase-like metal-dependent hydrolase (beta-lactamase superfamily II)